MRRFRVHTSTWTMRGDRAGAARTIPAAASYGMDVVEIARLDTANVDAAQSRDLLGRHRMRAVRSLGLPTGRWTSVTPDGAADHLRFVLDTAAAMGAKAMTGTGVTDGGIGERTGLPPTETAHDTVACDPDAAASHATSSGLVKGIEPVNRSETHLLNTGWRAREMIGRVGAENRFIHLDTCHMSIVEKGAANGVLDAQLQDSGRGTPGEGTCDRDEIFALAAIGFRGGFASESSVDMPPEIAHGRAVWHPVAPSFKDAMDKGMPFLRNNAAQYRLT